MKLKQVELNGFKSFAKKSKLDFSEPVTTIVGPNGSGKSNVVEAFRFVLGEQSMKSLRGKSSKDLIFKGSKNISKSNRAHVKMVFDNSKKVFKLGDMSDSLKLDYDEVEISREVLADGTNNYYINNISVRLKDVIELLSSVNIGSSGHNIISQGEADRILTANLKDRRLMIEDALGLKVYQYKIKDSVRKLEKTEVNMKEVQSLRRELAPHIRYLKKTVDKIKKGEELQKELSELYVTYFIDEEDYLSSEEKEIKSKKETIDREIKEIEVKLSAFKEVDLSKLEQEKNDDIHKAEEAINLLNKTKDDLSRKLGRIEGILEFEDGEAESADEVVKIPSVDVDSFVGGVEDILEKALKNDSLTDVKASLMAIKDSVARFKDKFQTKSGKTDQKIKFKDLKETKAQIVHQLAEMDKEREKEEAKIIDIRKSITKEQDERFKDQEVRFELENKRNSLVNQKDILDTRTTMYKTRKTSFEEEMREAVVLVGSQIKDYKKEDRNDLGIKQEELRKKIERIKIKLEDIGTGSGEDALKEYEEVTARDEFLLKELEDLQSSIQNLNTLITDLKETLENEFKNGLNKINEKFEEFFKLMFGGGNAYLSIVVQQKRKKSEDDEEHEVDENDKVETGIDINVSLPQKKVKELTMLSGGERSLTSIALLFAMTQVNPPPFLVLDETDAALDEANSKRYGDMIEKLAKYSQLVVVTHNRETMSRGDVIYGVTIGADGGSKLLSIKFTEAQGYAK